MLKLPRRILADWTPDDGDLDQWLARWETDGWVPILDAGRPQAVSAL